MYLQLLNSFSCIEYSCKMHPWHYIRLFSMKDPLMTQTRPSLPCPIEDHSLSSGLFVTVKNSELLFFPEKKKNGLSNSVTACSAPQETREDRDRTRLDSMVLLIMKLDQLDQDIENALSTASSPSSTPTNLRRRHVPVSSLFPALFPSGVVFLCVCFAVVISVTLAFSCFCFCFFKNWGSTLKSGPRQASSLPLCYFTSPVFTLKHRLSKLARLSLNSLCSPD